mmetsp:Transcript_71854/g.135568  ORF Transcript_71854/g.135568 Transcript_71854/m.135568 type:complete len:95 (+) Transcript_71854:763-1047(+)
MSCFYRDNLEPHSLSFHQFQANMLERKVTLAFACSCRLQEIQRFKGAAVVVSCLSNFRAIKTPFVVIGGKRVRSCPISHCMYHAASSIAPVFKP